MSRLQLTFIALSLLVHGIIYFLLSHQTPAPVPPTPIEVIWREPPERKWGGPSRGKSHPGRGLRFVPNWRPFSPGGQDGANVESNNSGSSEEWGTQGDVLRALGSYISYDHLLTEIDGLLNYPAILGRRGYEGTVNVRLAFQGQRGCEWRRTKFYAAEQHLRIYILTLLKKLCSLKVVNQFKEGQSIDLSFQFKIGSPPANDAELSAKIIGRVILFSRLYPKLPLEYQLGPIRGVWFVPFVTLDIPYLIQKWDEYVNGIDPMAPFRE